MIVLPFHALLNHHITQVCIVNRLCIADLLVSPYLYVVGIPAMASFKSCMILVLAYCIVIIGTTRICLLGCYVGCGSICYSTHDLYHTWSLLIHKKIAFQC